MIMKSLREILIIAGRRGKSITTPSFIKFCKEWYDARIKYLNSPDFRKHNCDDVIKRSR